MHRTTLRISGPTSTIEVELDFIVNDDIKYCMSRDAAGKDAA
ncbi:MAG: hypothetical protein ABI728_10135 [Betaproteobacteria bacterium]